MTLAARSTDRLAEAVAALSDRGLHAQALSLDVSDIEATERTMAAGDPFDILVNSAAWPATAPPWIRRLPTSMP